MIPLPVDTSNFVPSSEPVVMKDSAGLHSDGIRLNHKRSSNIMDTPLFHWIKKRLPSPGAGNFAWTSLGLVELGPFGPAVSTPEYHALQAPELYLAPQLAVTNGLGGLIAGQYISQPLIDYEAGTYGGTVVNP